MSFTKALVSMLILAALPGSVMGQTTDKVAQEQWKTYLAQVNRFQKDAVEAFNREMDREKANPCRDAMTTRAVAACLGGEVDTATANYKAFFEALRSRLTLKPGSDEDQTPGPTGVPLTTKELVQELEESEAAWQKYREAQGKAAYDLFKGGTAAGPQGSASELMLIRSHMRELEKVYYSRLYN